MAWLLVFSSIMALQAVAALVLDPAFPFADRAVALAQESGTLAGTNVEDDWFFEAEAGDEVSVRGLPETTGRLYLRLRNSAGQNLVSVNGTSGAPVTIAYYPITTPGTYHVRVLSPDGGLPYDLRVWLNRAPLDLERPPNDMVETATVLRHALPLSGGYALEGAGALDAGDKDGDVFALGFLAAGETVGAILTPGAGGSLSAGDLEAELLDAAGTPLAILPDDGSANHLLAQSGPHYLRVRASNRAGTALSFDGELDAAALPPEVLDGQEDVTVQFWWRTEDGKGQALVSASGNANAKSFLIVHRSNRIYLHSGASATNSVNWSTGSVADGRWRHYTVVREGSANRAELFIDGVSLGARNLSMPVLAVAEGGLFLGQEQHGAVGSFDATRALAGDLDDLRIWHRALGAGDVAAQFDQPLTGTESGLAAWWQFDEAEGNALADSGPGSFAGHLGGTGLTPPTRVPSYAPIEFPGGMEAVYLVRATITDPISPTITGSDLPGPGGTTTDMIHAIALEFSEEMNPAAVNNSANYELRHAGADGIFGTDDDYLHTLVADGYTGGLATVIGITDGPLQPGLVRFTAASNLHDRAGNPMDAPWVRTFTVEQLEDYVMETVGNDSIETATPLITRNEMVDATDIGLLAAAGRGTLLSAAELDFWSFEAHAGDRVLLAVHVPGNPANSGMNWRILSPSGSSLRNFSSARNTGDGQSAPLTLEEDGTYFIRVSRNYTYAGEYRFRLLLLPDPWMWETEANNNPGQANALDFIPDDGVLRALVGSLLHTADSSGDFFALGHLGEGTEIRVGQSWPAFAPRSSGLALVNASGTVLADAPPGTANLSTTLGGGEAGPYYVRLTSAERGLSAFSFLAIELEDPHPPMILGDTLPEEGTHSSDLANRFVLTLPKDVDPTTANDPTIYEMRGAGPDGILDTADDIVYTLAPVSPYAGGVTLSLLVEEGPLQAGAHRFTVSTGLRDRFGNTMDAPYVRSYVIEPLAGFLTEGLSANTRETANPLALEPVGGVIPGILAAAGRGNVGLLGELDYWRFSGLAGERVLLAVEAPGNPSGSALVWRIERADGSLLSSFTTSSGAGVGQSAPVVLPEDGDYYLRASHYLSGVRYFGEYRFRLMVLPPPWEIEAEANNRINQANPIALVLEAGMRRGYMAGMLHTGDTHGDFFNLGFLTEGTLITVRQSWPAQSPTSTAMALLDASGTPLAEAEVGETELTHTVGALEAGEVFVRVTGDDPGLFSQYLLRVEAGDLEAPSITGDTLPEEGTVSTALIDRATLTFSKEMDPASVAETAHYELRGTGPDGVFGTDDDFIRIAELRIPYTGGLEAHLIFPEGPLQPGAYRFAVSAALTDAFGNPLADDYVRHFTLANLDGFALETLFNESPETATGIGLIDTEEFDRSFTPGAWVDPEARPLEIQAADLNGNGHDDLIAICRIGSTNRLSVWLGQGDGSFGPRADYETLGLAASLVLADFNGDGFPDAALLSRTDRVLHVFLNNGDGSFAGLPNHLLPDSPQGLAAGDLTGNGLTDLVAPNFADYFSVLLGMGDGTFGPVVDTPLPGNRRPRVPALADVDGDGHLDLVMADDVRAEVSVHLGNGDGTFGEPILLEIPLRADFLATGDVTGNGLADIVALRSTTDRAFLLAARGGGAFAPYEEINLGGSATNRELQLLDLDGDGFPDLLVSRGNVLLVAYNTGNGSFGNPANYDFAATVLSCGAGNLLGNGRTDLAVGVQEGDGRIRFLEGLPKRELPQLTVGGTDIGHHAAAGRGNLRDADDVDYWSFSARAGQILLLGTEIPGLPAGMRLSFRLHAPDGTSVLTINAPTALGLVQSAPVELPIDGTYHLSVQRATGVHSGEYRFRIHLLPPPWEWEREPNNTPAQANTPAFTPDSGVRRARVAGLLLQNDTSGDFHALGHLAEGMAVRLRIDWPDDRPVFSSIALTDATGAVLAENAPGVPDLLRTITAGEAGPVFARVSGEDRGLFATYFLRIELESALPPRITDDSLPEEATVTTALIDRFTIDFSEEMDPATVNDPPSYELRGAGPDGVFGTADDVLLHLEPLAPYSGGTHVTLWVVDGPLTPGFYRFTGDTALRNLFGTGLAQPYVRTFEVHGISGFVTEWEPNDTADTATALSLVTGFPGLSSGAGRGRLSIAADRDFWSFEAEAGTHITIGTENPGEPLNSRVAWQLQGPDGTSLWSSGSTTRGWLESSPIPLAQTGTYFVRAARSDNFTGEYRFRASLHHDGREAEIETNDTIATATPLTFQSDPPTQRRWARASGSIRPAGDLDYFHVGPVVPGETVFLVARIPQHAAFQPVVALYAADGTYLAEAPGGRPFDAVAQIDVTTAVDAYALVRAAGGGGGGLLDEYVLDVEIMPTAALAFPNLQVVEVADPPPAPRQSGDPLTFTFRVANVGYLPTETDTWFDLVAVSTVPYLDDTARVIGSYRRTGALAVGESYTVTETAALPEGISGDFYLIVFTDHTNRVNEFLLEGDNETANDTPFPVSLAPYPDLVVRNLSVTGPDATGSFEARWETANLGTAPVPRPFRERLRVEPVTGGPTVFGTYLETTTLLAVGEQLERAVTFQTGASGDFRLSVTTDVDDVIYEHDGVSHETAEQNTVATTFSVSAEPPIIHLFTWNGSPLAEGATITGRGTLAVVAGDARGLARAEFFHEADGATRRTLIGRDENPADGLDAVWNPALFDDGDYQITVRVYNTLGLWAETARQIRLELATPPPPLITQPSSGFTTGEVVVSLRVQATPETTIRFFRDEELIISASTDAAGLLIRDLPLLSGENLFTASALNRAGESPLSNTVTVIRRRDFPPLLLTFEGFAVGEGLPVEGTVSIEEVLTEDLAIRLSTNRPNRFDQLPAPILPAGATSVSFTFAARQDTIIQAPTTVLVTAAAEAHASAVVELLLLDDDAPLLTVELEHMSVSEDHGIVSGIVTRDPVENRPVRVDLVNDHPHRAFTPAFVTIPAGHADAAFNITVIDNGIADGDVTLALVAEIRAGGTVVATSAPVLLEIRDDDGASLQLLPARPNIRADAPPVSVSLHRRGAETTAALAVTLESAPAGWLDHPANVEIAPGSQSVAFPVSLLPGAAPEGSLEVTLRATAGGFSAGHTTLLATDEDLPDLAVSQPLVASEALTESYLDVSYRIDNHGFAPAEGPFMERVFLSPTPFLSGEAILVRQVMQGVDLAPGGYYGRHVSILAPRETGIYHLIVQVDPTNDLEELTKANNTAVRAEPIEIRAAYTATVEIPQTIFPANQPITFSGRVTAESGAPAAHAMVDLHIGAAGTNRVISAIANAAGDYSVTWTPLRNEGGHYTIGATHPGVSATHVQANFEILTLGLETPPGWITLHEGETVVAEIVLRNPNDRSLHAPVLHFGETFAGLSILPAATPSVIEAGGLALVPVSISAAPGHAGSDRIALTATTAEGIVVEGELRVRAQWLRPQLEVRPEVLSGAVLRGETRTLELELTNTGALETGLIDILIPDVPWLAIASVNPLPSIPPGGVAGVTFTLTPPEDAPLTQYSGRLALNPANGGSRNVPYRLRTVTEMTGDLRVAVVNELYYYTEEAPRLEGAQVTVLDAISGEMVADAVTDADGFTLFTDLPEGWYALHVFADDHDSYNGHFYVNAGEENEHLIFISRQFVKYHWTVERVPLEDVYRVVLETVFETNVPVPVVTVTPTPIELGDLTELGQVKVVPLTLENHGWIDAYDTHLSFSSHPFYDFAPLIRDVGTIPSKSSIVIPLRITRTGVFGEDGSIILLGHAEPDAYTPFAEIHSGTGPVFTRPVGGGVPCGAGGTVNYTYPCGPANVGGNAPIPTSGGGGDCGGPGGGFGGGGWITGGPGGSGGTGTSGTRSVSGSTSVFSSDDNCPCLIPNLCAGLAGSMNLSSLANMVANGLRAVVPPFIKISDVSVEVSGSAEACVCCTEDGSLGMDAKGDGSVELKGSASVGFYESITVPFDAGGSWKNAEASVSALAGVKLDFTGSVGASIQRTCGGEMVYCFDGGVTLGLTAGLQLKGSAKGTYILEGVSIPMSGEAEGTLAITGSASVTVSGCSDGPVTYTACAEIGPEVSISAKLSGGGIEQTLSAGFDLPRYEAGDCGGGGPAEWAEPLHAFASTATFQPLSDPDPDWPILGLIGEPFGFLFEFEGGEAPRSSFSPPPQNLVYSPAEIIATHFPLLREPMAGVCARVRIHLSQDVMMTRSAFLATLELQNERSDELTDVGFVFHIHDEFGNPADDLFNLRLSRLRGLDEIDGAGRIAGYTTGAATWTLVPRDTAALEAPANYTIGGTIRYTQGSLQLNIPVQDMPITVYPDAALALKYFHQRDVYSNDPWTGEIEPAEPFKLAVVVSNEGFGAARDLRIVSGQPKIVENEKGLFIDFKVIGTEVEGEPLTPSLSAEFGTLAGGARKVAVWSLTASLHGQFVEYEATFEHVTGLGDPRLSLMRSVEIFEMIRLIRNLEGDPGTDYAFLTDDVPDVNREPDTIHFRDGSTVPVVLRETGTFSVAPSAAEPVVALQTGAFTGWAYIRLPDPSDGDYILVSVTRSDGRVLPLGENAWQTDRRFPGMGHPAVYENHIHLVDANSSGLYSLEFVPREPPPAEPPSSRVVELPALSPPEFPVFWRGTDDRPIAEFDIYVSADGGPYELWRSGTADRGGLYSGNEGTIYGFYSIARDAVGQSESKAPLAEAVTTVGLANEPPVLEPIADQSLTAGGRLLLQVSATDPDGDDAAIRFSLASGPAGMNIDPVSGLLEWNTGLGDADRTIHATVRATDGGHPPASAQTSFPVAIHAPNRAPLIAPIGPQTVPQGGVLVVQVDAVDVGIPPRSLLFEILEGPTGATLDPASGLLQWAPEDSDAGRTHAFLLRVSITDAPSVAATLAFSVNVVEAPFVQPPFFTGIPVVLWLKGRTHTLNLYAVDPHGEPIEIRADIATAVGATFADYGGGHANLRWNPSGSASGVYEIPLMARARGRSATAHLRVRVEEENLYWEWVEDTFGASFPTDFDLAQLDKEADPDGDGRPNVHEMAFLTHPLHGDSVPLHIGVEHHAPFRVVHLRFDRRTGSHEYVNFAVRRGPTPEGPWSHVPPSDFAATIQPAPDGRPDAQTVGLEIFEHHPDDPPERSFYLIETTQKTDPP